jgi:hypothetical protein
VSSECPWMAKRLTSLTTSRYVAVVGHSSQDAQFAYKHIDFMPGQLDSDQTGSHEGVRMPSSIEVNRENYIEPMCALFQQIDKWLLRRVVSVAMVDADVFSVRVSVDIDLREATSSASNYISRVERDELELVIPVGLYPSPYVGFDLRDSADTRLSLVSGPTRDHLQKSMQNRGTCPTAAMRELLEKGSPALVVLPKEYCTGRHTIHYRYLSEWKLLSEKYAVRPINPGAEAKPSRQLIQQLSLSMSPAKVTLSLDHPNMSHLYHLEVLTPEGVSVYQPRLYRGENEPVAGVDPQHILPPGHGHLVYEYKRDEEHSTQDGEHSTQPELGQPMTLVAWLGLVRQGFPSAVLFLTFLNLLAVCAALYPAFFELDDLYGDGPDGRVESIVTVQVVVVAVSYAFLHLPGEHGLARSLYGLWRWLLTSSATLLLVSALILAIRPEPRIALVLSEFILFGLNFILFVWILIMFLRSGRRFCENWVEGRSGEEKRYGRHSVTFGSSANASSPGS